MMVPEQLDETPAILERAHQLYEAVREAVSGRPAWEKLDPACPYDMGMRAVAITNARAEADAKKAGVS